MSTTKPFYFLAQNERKDTLCSGQLFVNPEVSSDDRLLSPWPQKSIAPLICRVVRAMRAVRWRWALGLDSQWGTPLRSVSTPNLRWLNLPRDFNVFSSGCRLSYTSGYVPLQNRSKRPPVLRDRKVLPEVRNRPLLLKEHFKSRTLKKWLRIQ